MTARGRPVLLAAAGLHMVTQTALAPFYPALFRAVYGVDDLAATGVFLMVCQLSAVAALPLWGRATRRFPLTGLVVTGQSAAVVLAAALALAPSYAVFVAVSAALVAAKAVVLLAYPGLAAGHPRGFLPGVVQYVAVLHAASAVATVLGAAVVAVPDPRAALPLLAAVEGGLLLVCVTVLRNRRGRRPGRPAPPPPGVGTAAGPARSALLPLAGYVLVTAVAVHAVRPYFTEYAASGGASTTTAALLFLLPHLTVLAVLPAARRLRARLGHRLLPVALLLAASGLLLQAVSAETLQLTAGRVAFGAGLGLGQVALDERVLLTAGSQDAYSLIAAAQTCGLLLAPLLATVTATATLWAPLAAGAALFTGLALICPRPARPPTTDPLPTRPPTVTLHATSSP